MEVPSEEVVAQHELRLGKYEALTLAVIWLSGVVAIVAIVALYEGSQQVSLENAIGYIVIGMVLVSLAVLFRDAIVNWLRSL